MAVFGVLEVLQNLWQFRGICLEYIVSAIVWVGNIMTPKKNLYFFGAQKPKREIGKSFPQLKSFEFFFEAFLIMGYNYAWLLSASYVELSLTNAIFQLSVVRSPGIFCASRYFTERKLLRLFLEKLLTQLMVNCWFGLVVWVVTIPFIFGDPKYPNHRAPNHQFTISSLRELA